MLDRELAARRLLVVTEEELQRIVLDVHDGPVQNIFAALSQLEHVRARVRARPELTTDCGAALERAIGLLESAVDDIRGMMTTFRAPEFATRDLAAIVEELAVQHEALTGAAVALDVAQTLPTLSTIAKTVVYRVVQEALSNIRRHAGVPEADLRPVGPQEFGAHQASAQERHSDQLALTQLLIAYHLLRKYSDVGALPFAGPVAALSRIGALPAAIVPGAEVATPARAAMR